MNKNTVFVSTTNTCGLLPFLKLASAIGEVVTDDANTGRFIRSGGLRCRFTSKRIDVKKFRGVVISILPDTFGLVRSIPMEGAGLDRIILALCCAHNHDRIAVISRVDDYFIAQRDLEGYLARKKRLRSPASVQQHSVSHPVSMKARTELAEHSLGTAASWLSQCRSHLMTNNCNGTHA